MSRSTGVIAGLTLFASFALPTCRYGSPFLEMHELRAGLGQPELWPFYVLRACIGEVLTTESRPSEPRVARAIAMCSAVAAQYALAVPYVPELDRATMWGVDVGVAASLALASAALARMNEATRKLPRAQVR